MSAIRDPQFLCLLVTSRLDRDGYAYHGKSRAHIVAYQHVSGPIATGLEIDHLCRRRHCIEPLHLEAVSRDENEHRKAYAWRARRKLCPRGHSMQGAAITPEMGRLCRTCQDAIRSTEGNMHL